MALWNQKKLTFIIESSAYILLSTDAEEASTFDTVEVLPVKDASCK